MRTAVINVLEMILGAIILCFGLLYLSEQYRNLDKLTEITTYAFLDNDNLYQQYNNINFDQISDDELNAIIMGFREYPIVIDGVQIAADDSNYEDYLNLVRNGFYTKSYECGSDNHINRIIFTYAGM